MCSDSFTPRGPASHTGALSFSTAGTTTSLPVWETLRDPGDFRDHTGECSLCLTVYRILCDFLDYSPLKKFVCLSIELIVLLRQLTIF